MSASLIGTNGKGLSDDTAGNAINVVVICTAGYHNAHSTSHTTRNILFWARLWHMDVNDLTLGFVQEC